MIINFLSAYERYNGSIEYRLKKIAINYLTGFFAIDFIATFPFNWVTLKDGEDEADGPDTNSLLRLVRV